MKNHKNKKFREELMPEPQKMFFREDQINFFIYKSFIPGIIIFIILRVYGYYNMKEFVPFSILDIFLLGIIMFFVAFVIQFIKLLQDQVGEVMQGTWKDKLMYIALAIALIYLYKVSGRI